MQFDKDIMDEFLSESREHLEIIEQDLLNLESSKGKARQESIKTIFRAIHSIKGAAGFLGLEKINDLSHLMETLLSMMRSGELEPQKVHIDNLLTGVDVLNVMFSDVYNSNETDISKIVNNLDALICPDTGKQCSLHQPVSNLTDILGQEMEFKLTAATLENLPGSLSYLYNIVVNLQDLDQRGITPVSLIRALIETGQVIDTHLVIEAEDLRLGLPQKPPQCHILYATALEPSLLSTIDELHNSQITQVERPKPTPKSSPKPKIEEEEKLITFTKQKQPEVKRAEPDPLYSNDSGTKTFAGENSSIRIKVDILEELMRLAGELVLVRNQQLLVAEQGESKFRGITQRLDIVTSELQEVIMKTRMQPIGNIFNKFHRIVRDIGDKLGKSINLTIKGAEVELDKTILENLTDPLTHMIRNSCDHGLETAEERMAAGKPEEGSLELQAYHEAGHIIVTVSDDGKGIDPEKVKEKALTNGLATQEDINRMSTKEIQELIFLPGFSTNAEVSEFSGRGVGMDVVKSCIEKLGGKVDLISTPGQGTSICMRLPLTLAIIPCLIIMVGDERFAIPQVNLEEMVCLYDTDALTRVEVTEGREVYRLRNRLLPMVRLSDILDNPKRFSQEKVTALASKHQNQRADILHKIETGEIDKSRYRDSLYFAVIRAGEHRMGLIIDKVIGTEEVVVKPMHRLVKKLDSFAGATVMGDGRVALILNIEGVARHARIEKMMQDNLVSEHDASSTGEMQNVMLFQSGKVEQYALALPLIRRIEKISGKDIETVGSRQFVTVDGISTQVLRLNSVLSVSEVDEKDEMFLILPKHIQRPFGILASSLNDIIEVPLNLNTDSYMEDGLLGTSIINDRMTLFPDIYRLIEKVEPDWFQHRRTQTKSAHKSRILLAEDTKFFQQMVKGYLESDAYEVTVAENGQQALDLFQENEYDMIVSDLEMPEMDGFEFIKAVRHVNPNIPAMALSALSDDEDIETAHRCGFNEYNVKIDREKLLTTVSRLLNGGK